MTNDKPGITAERLATWMTPIEAAAYAARALQTDDTTETARAIWERVVSGLIRTACSHMSETYDGHRPNINRTPLSISANLWEKFTENGSNFWSGDARFYIGGATHNVIRCFGIRLYPEHVRSTLPIPPANNLESVPAPPPITRSNVPLNIGGRPRKAWWDDLWVEMARQLYAGDLHPKKQADIEKAMADWVFALGQEASERSIRDAARKLWRAINEEGKN
jgi:hypothetical protein